MLKLRLVMCCENRWKEDESESLSHALNLHVCGQSLYSRSCLCEWLAFFISWPGSSESCRVCREANKHRRVRKDLCISCNSNKDFISWRASLYCSKLASFTTVYYQGLLRTLQAVHVLVLWLSWEPRLYFSYMYQTQKFGHPGLEDFPVVWWARPKISCLPAKYKKIACQRGIWSASVFCFFKLWMWIINF